MRTGGPDVGGPDVLLCVQNWTSRPPLLQSYILCDTGGPDVGGPDVGGPDVGGPDVGGPDVGGPDVQFPFLVSLLTGTSRRFQGLFYNSVTTDLTTFPINTAKYTFLRAFASPVTSFGDILVYRNM